MSEQPKRVLSWMALNKMENYWKWRLRVAKYKGEDTAEIKKRVEAIREAKEQA